MKQMVIANRLRDGLIVFLGVDGSWVEQIADGLVSESVSGSEELLRVSKQAELDCKVIDQNLIDVTQKNGTRIPDVYREAIRTAGPTVQTTQSTTG